ncbi:MULTISPECIES: spore germination protein [Neobacillus]|uniref:Spore germination protein n=1 Tax=Neobacillus rhizophilus TaxID=2833579 RepID=A0A942YXW6_9BACI|nr:MULTISPECIES: spore germination protein [Neobacillus]MBS4214306.1 spore germination protein [Neobacillus rhizophilus]MBU8915901.1 spore germination protein [Bacillus sp. FJAT-29953]
MPAIINGAVTIDNIGGDGDVQFGDLVFITPKTASKTEGGSGVFNTGGAVITNTGASFTNYIDPSVIDMPIKSNN